jgi:phage host-nuclease inhibitor protein Gam
MEEIQYIGADQLTEGERIALNTLSAEYYDKIKRMLKNDISLVIQIKEYKKAAPRKKEELAEYQKTKRKKYALHIRVLAPTRMFEEKHAADWDFARTLHKAFNNLEKEIQHRLHTDDQKSKAGSSKSWLKK